MIQTVSLSDDLSETLVRLVLQKAHADPVQIANTHLILPTRRACRTVKEAFLRQTQGHSTLLPHLIPLYELDDLETDILPAMPDMERTLLLAKLCQAKPNIITPDQAMKVAISLGQLLDEFYQFEVDTSQISELVQDSRFAQHWNETLIFLDIITESWPRILQEHHQLDTVQRRIQLIDSYTHKIKRTPPDLIIAAGLDGGLPVLRRLLSTINTLPNGYILSEGIDTHLTEEQWDDLPEHHYLHSSHLILKALKEKGENVTSLSGPLTDKEILIQEALKPENRTEEWRHSPISEKAIAHLNRIDCATNNDEALTIAYILRQVLETPHQTGALITPDRQLARRVALEMKRWGVVLDDSAGIPISQTDIGIFLHLIGQYALTDQGLLALLKHPLSADGQNPMAFRQTIKAYEKQVRHDKNKFNPPLNTDFTPFKSFFTNNILTPFKDILTEHIRLAETLATSSDRTGVERLWQDEAGKTVFSFLTDLLSYTDLIGEIEPAYYLSLLDILMSGLTVRHLFGMHPRLDILGPIEARFHHYDVCIIGGLNEGTFPPLPETGPWLNRAMRQTLALPDPDTKIASLSMDFAHCFCSPTVYLTRSQKSEGAETIPSRFLSRLEAVLEGKSIPFPIHHSIGAHLLNKPEQDDFIVRPAPCPPVSARPTTLSVTKIELWMRNPYAIYARYILKLFPLDPLESDQKQNLFGSAIHKALEEFIRQNPNHQDISVLTQLADHYLTEFGLSDTDKAFYMPRFQQIAEFFVDYQRETPVLNSFTEQLGSFTFDVNGHPFTITGTADRIDILTDGTVRLIDYKTGSVPSQKEVVAGFAPQLPLEAFILSQNGFKGITPAPISALSYVKLASKKSDCKEINLLTGKIQKSATDLITDSFDHLQNLIDIFNQPTTPYEPCPIAGKEPTYNDYEHLSRSAEWMNGEEE